MPDLTPHDMDGQRLRRSSSLRREFLEPEAVELPQRKRQVILQKHCHQQAVLKPDAMVNVLSKMGLQVEQPETGCCGMVGAFGLEAEHYEISQLRHHAASQVENQCGRTGQYSPGREYSCYQSKENEP